METSSGTGLVAGVGGLLKNLLGLLLSRIELASLELADMRANLVRLALLFGFAALAVWFALACWTALVVVLAWESWGWKILLLLAALFTLVAGGVLLWARTLLRQNALSMPATLAELRADRDALL